ncbi:hypothetical protein [Methylocystis bryophila]|uniref:Uncharacterized protein n=1 Tax=Methylocystis bryophila TaxID=655015 RepID=A0A1W6MTE0_9HYPH|nr:hypothetical protein [Methylocystis bryophila]ARN80870.1 hypothetical protein B1812_07025 [Methylocystis bryophila]BDV36751.1 hypothetical protein DSM21852_00040 [Methylocystis bryophila]
MSNALTSAAPTLALAASAAGTGLLLARGFLKNAVSLSGAAQRVGDTKVWDGLVSFKQGKLQLGLYLTLRRID